MTTTPTDRKYAASHEWLAADGKVGITDHAQEQLGDVVYVELPEVGDEIVAGTACAVVESVKAASDVYTPASGTVVEGNAELEASPALVNEDPEGDGWFFRLTLSDPSELEGLMDADKYAAFVAKL